MFGQHIDPDDEDLEPIRQLLFARAQQTQRLAQSQVPQSQQSISGLSSSIFSRIRGIFSSSSSHQDTSQDVDDDENNEDEEQAEEDNEEQEDEDDEMEFEE